MCINCFEGYPEFTNEKVEHAARLIKALYETETGGVGGYGHLVFDDWNLDCIDGCLNDAYEGKSDWITEETRQASITALAFCKTITEDEIANALRVFKHY